METKTVERICKLCGTQLSESNTDEYCRAHKETLRSVFVISSDKGHTQICLGGDSIEEIRQSIEADGEKVRVTEIKVAHTDFFKLKEVFETLLNIDDELMMAFAFTVPRIVMEASRKQT